MILCLQTEVCLSVSQVCGILRHYTGMLYIVQHYQKDPDGLCCRLKYICEKEGSHDIVVSLEDFKSSESFIVLLSFCTGFYPLLSLIYHLPLLSFATEGWAIPRSELVLSKQIGKGEFGGERLS